MSDVNDSANTGADQLIRDINNGNNIFTSPGGSYASGDSYADGVDTVYDINNFDVSTMQPLASNPVPEATGLGNNFNGSFASPIIADGTGYGSDGSDYSLANNSVMLPNLSQGDLNLEPFAMAANNDLAFGSGNLTVAGTMP